MEINIFQSLISIFQSCCVTHPLGRTAIMAYLLGEDVIHEGNTFDDTQLLQIANNHYRLSVARKNTLYEKTQWKLSFLYKSAECPHNLKLDEEKLFRDVRTLYQQMPYTSELCDASSLTIDVLIGSLVKYQIFQTPYPESLFAPYHEKTCNNYAAWEEMHSTIHENLCRSNILIISGMAGIGKTQLLKGYIASNASSYTEIGWEDEFIPNASIKDLLDRLPFLLTTPKARYDRDVLSVLAEKSRKTLLVIDCPTLTYEDYKFLIQNLYNKEIRLIVTTHCNNFSDRIPHIHIDQYPVNILYNIFEYGLNGKPFPFQTTDFTHLLDIVERNTLVISLLAKTIAHTALSTAKILEPIEWLWQDSSLGKIKSTYSKIGSRDEQRQMKGNGLSLTTHICHLLRKYGYLNESYSELAIWAKSEIDKTALPNWCNDGIIETCDNAYNLGLLEYTDADKKYIKMPSILADALWFDSPLLYEDYKNNISRFLALLALGSQNVLPYRMLYSSSLNLINRFHFSLIKENKRKMQLWHSQLNEWWDILENVLVFQISAGNANDSQILMRYIYKHQPYLTKEQRKDAPFNHTKKSPVSMNQEFRLFQLRLKLYLMNDSELDSGNYGLIKDIFSTKPDPLDDIQIIKFYELILDYLIRLGQTPDMRHNFSQLFQYINYYILKVYILSLNDSFVNYAKPRYLYYNFIYLYLLTIHEDSKNVQFARENFYELLQLQSCDSSLLMKAKIYQCYFELLFFLITTLPAKPCSYQLQQQQFNANFKLLKQEYKNKIWAWDITLLFHCAEILYETVVAAKTHNTETIKSCLDSITNLFQTQIKMPDAYDMSTLIDHIQAAKDKYM